MSLFPRSTTPRPNHFGDSRSGLASSFPGTPSMTASTPPTSSPTPYNRASPFFPAEETSDPPITRSRTLYYLSVRDSNASTTRSRRYRSRGTYGESEGGLMGPGAEERAGLMGDDESGRGGQHAIDVQGSGLPPRWSVRMFFGLLLYADIPPFAGWIPWMR